jgi:hypothetical protein
VQAVGSATNPSDNAMDVLLPSSGILRSIEWLYLPTFQDNLTVPS